MKIILPIKEQSTRVHDKNFRPFHNELSLSEIKIRQLLDNFIKSDIVVIGDGDRSKGLAKIHKVDYLSDKDYSHDFLSAIRYWFTQITDDDCIMTTFVTSPLFNYYEEIIRVWTNCNLYGKGCDSIFSASSFNHFITDESGTPMNFQYGYYHQTSDKLPNWVTMDWSCFIIDGKVAREAKYVVGRTPKIFLQPKPSVDIDIEEDFELAQWYYQKKL